MGNDAGMADFISFCKTIKTSVWASQMMVEIVNYFGHVGGFEQILGHAKEGSTKCPLAEIRVIVETFFQVFFFFFFFFLLSSSLTVVDQFRQIFHH